MSIQIRMTDYAWNGTALLSPGDTPSLDGSVAADLVNGGKAMYISERESNKEMSDVKANVDPVTGGSILWSAAERLNIDAEATLPVGQLSVVASITPTRTGAMRVALSAVTAGLARLSALQDLCAMQDGRLIPLDVPPGTTKAAGGVLFVGVRSLSRIDICSSSVIEQSAARTWVPSGMRIGTVETAFSGTHSGAGANNPITSFTHPSIVDCGTAWNGHRYWASVTPWLGSGWPSADAYEDPMIFYSDDLATWTPINRGDTFANLFDARTTLGATYLSSDARLVFDNAKSTLHCYWRLTKSANEEYLVHLQTTNGTTWVPASGTGNYDTLTLTNWTGISAYAFKSDDAVNFYTSCQSPSICKVGGMWHMWTLVETQVDKYNKLRYFTSNDGLDWTGGDSIAPWWSDDFIGPWHGDVQYDPDSGQFVFMHMLGRGGGSGAPIQNNTLATFLSVSRDGVHWTMDDCPISVSGPDTTITTPQKQYKPCAVRVGVNSWVFASSFTTATLGGRISIAPAVTLNFSRQQVTAAINGVFKFPVGRWFGNRYSVAQYGLLQEQPGWRNMANNAVNITSGVLNLRRRATGAASVFAGNKCNHSYEFEAWLKPTGPNAKIQIINENLGEKVGITYDYFDATTNSFKLCNSGTFFAHTLVSVWQFWRFTAIEASNGDMTLSLYIDDVLIGSDTRTAAQMTTLMGALQFQVSGDTPDNDGFDIRYAVVSVPEWQKVTI